MDAWVLESAVHPDTRWTVYGRAEIVDNDELLAAPIGSNPQRVGKVELGVIRDFRVASHILLGIGAQAARNFVGHDLTTPYDGDRWGEMVFLRAKID